MSLHLVTGCAGEAHITSADQGAYNMATYGGGEFVLDRGNKFVTTLVSNNAITVADGEAMMQGRYIRMTPGTSETVAIDNGSTGMKRNDLICLRYEKDISTGFESASLSVVKGTPSSSTPTDPSYTHGDITDDDDPVNEMPLYRVYINGLNIETITPLFTVKVSMVEYMDEYQLPIAAANRLGGVKIGSNISIADDGKISVGDATTSAKGVMKVGTGLSVNSGTVSLKAAVHTQIGGVKIGRGIWFVNDEIRLRLDSTALGVTPENSITIPSTHHTNGTFYFNFSSTNPYYKALVNNCCFPVCAWFQSVNGVIVSSVWIASYDGTKCYFIAHIHNFTSSSITISTSNTLNIFLYKFDSTYDND